MENWREINGFQDYSISSLGRVRNELTGRMLALSRNQQGVVNVALHYDGRQYRRSVAKLVLMHFLGDSGLSTPTHLDGDKTNCAVDNLRATSHATAYRHHRMYRPR